MAARSSRCDWNRHANGRRELVIDGNRVDGLAASADCDFEADGKTELHRADLALHDVAQLHLQSQSSRNTPTVLPIGLPDFVRDRPAAVRTVPISARGTDPCETKILGFVIPPK